eukprot:TRINITY_DN105737_c0_g1_i1.p1 TRINITY_DN105737_c0_g1~~TRINITY_DN105737_c0_g1_i1.p1  ORF type:complete len:444 (+),score=114.25 TRINITY_DN105737_c0_g1_i1:69-1334(+)
MEGGSFDAAPPPTGLGNFKGVMLCNRPSEDTSKAGGAAGDEPFRSMIAATYSDKPGLTPCRNFEPTVKTRGPSAALRRHVRWLRELQDQMREERDQVDAEEQEAEERRVKMQATFDKHREAVRAMMEADDQRQREEAAIKKAAKQALREAEKAAKTGGTPPGATAPATEIVNAAAAEPKKQKKQKASKPLWAMTEQEREHFEEEEADDLINFAENLDFDKYVGDLEFREALDALRDRTGKLKKEQDAFKDDLLANFNACMEGAGDDEDYEASTAAGSSKWEDGVDGQSLLGDLRSEYSVASSKRSRREERAAKEGIQEWDGSTVTGDDGPKVDRDVKDMAEVVLESNPRMRGIHSEKSVQNIITKARERISENPVDDLVDYMRRDGPCPVPVITASSDTQNRLHKPVDPSMLPYLYRSPAI